MPRLCTIDGCERKHVARGLCGTHYNQQHQPNRHAAKQTTCVKCGKPVMRSGGGGRKYGATCSNDCRKQLAAPRKPKPPTQCELPSEHWARMIGATSAWPKGRARWGRFREAIFTDDYEVILDEIRGHCRTTSDGCWEWQRTLKGGYPVVDVGGRMKQVHRLALECKHSAPLGTQAAHHACANTKCVNPDHLQPVSHVENTIEMMQRNYYLQRIEELEQALRKADPRNDLLRHVGLPATL